MRLLRICIALTRLCTWLLSAAQPPSARVAAHSLGTLGPFSPTGHFETGFLPLGELHASKDGVLYTLSGTDLFRSTDGGAMWEVMPPFFAEDIALILSPDFDRDGKLFVGVCDEFDGVYLSSDGGYTWRSPQQPVPGPIGGFAISPSFAADQTLYAYQKFSNTLVRSVDGGEHWQTANYPPSSGFSVACVKAPLR